MPCPHCTSTLTKELPARTQLGYRTFRCQACRRIFNERTDTPFNYLEYPTDIVMLHPQGTRLWRLRYKLSLRDLAEMFLERGFAFTHEAVRDWEARFAPLLTEKLRVKRWGQVGRSWYVDDTYIKVAGSWCYLYRAIDRAGNLVDVRLSETRDMEGAQRFFRDALDIAGRAPERVTTDGHDAYPRAIRETLGDDVVHRCSPYLNNRLEQDHRGGRPVGEQRYYPMRGFGNVDAASRFCRAFDEQRQYFRVRQTMRERVPPLAKQRRVYCARWQGLMGAVMAA